jgi:hypothetical protein
MSEPYCAACRFWQPFYGESPVRYGACRRRAPMPVERPVFDLSDRRADWPVTAASDWCGEREPCQESAGT